MMNDAYAIDSELQELEFSRQAGQLADALVYALHIPPGHALAPFLSATSVCNRDAVVAWVQREMQNPDLELSRQCIQVLLPRLEQKLQSIREDLP